MFPLSPQSRRFNLFPQQCWVGTSSLFSFSPIGEAPLDSSNLCCVTLEWGVALAKFFNPLQSFKLLFWLQQSTEISPQESWTFNNFPRCLTKSALTRFFQIFHDHRPGGWDRFTSFCWVQSVPTSVCLLLDAQVADHPHIGSHNFCRSSLNHGCMVNYLL